MINLIEIALYFILSAFLIIKVFERPVWGIAYYMLNFFAQPQYWSWGAPLPMGMRWSLTAALLLLISMLMFGSEREFRKDPARTRTSIFALLIAINGLLVQLVFAYYPEGSWPIYVEMAKFVVLYFVIVQSIQSHQDFKIFIWCFVLGILYWGMEGRFFGTLRIDQGRLEGFGGPGCAASNELSSIMVALLPVIVGFLMLLKGRQRWITVASAVLGLNILLMTQSRGGFLGIIAGGIVLPLIASGRARKLAIRGFAVSTLAVVLLAGNPQILIRFMTTFATADSRGQSGDDKIAFENKESRKAFWRVGRQIVADYPLGSGGDTFKYERGISYIERAKIPYLNKSVHQGYINEAMDWGVQGLIFHMGFILSAIFCAFKTMKFRKRLGDVALSFFGATLISGFAGWLTTCLVGDFMHLEWGYWLCIISVCYAKLYGQANYGLLPDVMVGRDDATEGDPEIYRELAASGV